MILNYLLPSSLIYKVIKPNYEISARLIKNLNGEEIFEKRTMPENEIMFLDGNIRFGGLGFESSIKVERRSIEEDNIKYMNLINQCANKKLKIEGFSNGCNDLIMFLGFLQEHAENENSEHHQKAQDTMKKISDIQLVSPYQNFATSISHYISDGWNSGIIGKLLVGFCALLSPILLPIIAIAGLINKIIDISRGVDNSKVLSDEHLYNRFGEFLSKNPNIKGDIKYSVNDPMVGDFGIAEKDKNGRYKLKNEFNDYSNIKIHVSEETNHITERDDYKTVGKSQIPNIKIVSEKKIEDSKPFEVNISDIKKKNNEEKGDSIINNLLNYISPYNDTIYRSCDERNFSERSNTEYFTCKEGNESQKEKTIIDQLRFI
jgi:hypothetical protein